MTKTEANRFGYYILADSHINKKGIAAVSGNAGFICVARAKRTAHFVI